MSRRALTRRLIFDAPQYEKAVNINDRDPTYWCSIGVLYYYNSQYHDALDTYSLALQVRATVVGAGWLGILHVTDRLLTPRWVVLSVLAAEPGAV
jgi:hypothetical protein